MNFARLRRLSGCAKAALAGALVLATNAACHAQSCALCYTQAAGAGHRFIQGLRTGILVLIVPPMFMSVGITVLAYHGAVVDLPAVHFVDEALTDSLEAP